MIFQTAGRLFRYRGAPQPSLSSTGYCLSHTGAEYLVYQTSSGAFSVKMLAGTYNTSGSIQLPVRLYLRE